MTFTYGELFAGIGGMSLGLERAGMSPRWFVEIDPFCRRVLAKHWPDVPRYGDIKELTGHELEPVDLVCGGFPCQPVSLAGKRLGQDDERWLWPEFVRIVRVVRPRFVLVENTPGLYSRGMGDVLGDLAACGYDAQWDCIPAAAVGSPQLRERVWIVAYPQEQPIGAGLCADQPAAFGWGRPRDTVGTHRPWPDGAGVRRVAYGLPNRLDRLRGLGNAVVPQVAEDIGRRIMAGVAA